MGKNKVGKINRKEQLKEKLQKKFAISRGEKKICLTMIVKNESKNMVRLLDSLKEIIDMGSIVDTGSTDNTVEIIDQWSRENKIPIVIHHEPFVNFAHNRTHSYLCAKESFPEADYFLLSDADMVWKVKGNFNKSLLYLHLYTVQQENNLMVYENIRLISSKVNWHCVGVTHEIWEETKHQPISIGGITRGKISSLWIDDREDGGCKEDKFVRDRRLLEEALKDSNVEPRLRVRYTFYLAQTLRDMGLYEDSIEKYRERVSLKDWNQEVYWSKYQIGRIRETMGWNCQDEKQKKEILEDALSLYLDAYEYRKVRGEALACAVRLMRMFGRLDSALKWALKGKKIKFPDDSLFVEKAPHVYQFDYEIAQICVNFEDKQLGAKACQVLLERDDLPENIRNHVLSLTQYYV